MVFKFIKLILGLGFVTMLSGCYSTPDQLKKVIEENPEIILNMIEKHPKKFLDTINKSVSMARSQGEDEKRKKIETDLEEDFKTPKKPVISESRVFFGPKIATVTIVEYSDFQCPACRQGYNVMNRVKEVYGDKVRVLLKHLPLESIHPFADAAARYYEAIAQQSQDKARKFHDIIFENQATLRTGGMDFLNKSVKEVGAKLTKVKKTFKGSEVNKIMSEDLAEAKKFGFNGTPGFLVNGVAVNGAYPFEYFKKIIDRHLEKN